MAATATLSDTLSMRARERRERPKSRTGCGQRFVAADHMQFRRERVKTVNGPVNDANDGGNWKKIDFLYSLASQLQSLTHHYFVLQTSKCSSFYVNVLMSVKIKVRAASLD